MKINDPVRKSIEAKAEKLGVKAKKITLAFCGDCGEGIELVNGHWRHLSIPTLNSHVARPEPKVKTKKVRRRFINPFIKKYIYKYRVPPDVLCARCGHRRDRHSGHSASQPCLHDACSTSPTGGSANTKCHQFVVVRLYPEWKSDRLQSKKTKPGASAVEIIEMDERDAFDMTQGDFTKEDLKDHCLVCGKEIPPGPDFCSTECETKYILHHKRDVATEETKVTTGSSSALSSHKALYFHDIAPEFYRRVAKRHTGGHVKYNDKPVPITMNLNWRVGLDDPLYVMDRLNHMFTHFVNFLESGNKDDDNLGAIGWCVQFLMEAERLHPEVLAMCLGQCEYSGSKAEEKLKELRGKMK